MGNVDIYGLIDFRKRRGGGEGGKERERVQFVVLVLYALVGCFLHVPDWRLNSQP